MSWKPHLREGIADLTALRLFDYEAGGPDIARLDCNELAFAATPDEMETFARALREVAVHRYPDVSGLACPDFIERRVRTVVDLRHGLEAALRTLPGLVVYPSEANFVLVRVPADASEVARRLLQSRVLVKDVSRPGLLERCLRITVGTTLENERCVSALRDHLRVER